MKKTSKKQKRYHVREILIKLLKHDWEGTSRSEVRGVLDYYEREIMEANKETPCNTHNAWSSSKHPETSTWCPFCGWWVDKVMFHEYKKKKRGLKGVLK